MDIVIVESPAKARTIEKYLGKDVRVLASYGHVRDLSPKDGSVDPQQNFAMRWAIKDEKAKKRVLEIADALAQAQRLVLATDPDREGEAISWHLLELLKEVSTTSRRKKTLDNIEICRVAFNAITRSAVQAAFTNPRSIDDHLVNAYLARRALDYLVGFTLSPVLWRKLPGSRSAGRVQSVALRLICEREIEIKAFKAKEYWTVDAYLKDDTETVIKARLIELAGKRLKRTDLDEAAARQAATLLETATFQVRSVENKDLSRHPPPPFTTSTLQQEASRKLHFNATQTMKVAQALYEGVNVSGELMGLITYMRTDAVQVVPEAIQATRDVIATRFGADYCPNKPRHYATRAKNAQEAHEAIRPTDLRATPDDIAHALNDDQKKLYGLIWSRMVASQMASASLARKTIIVQANSGEALLQAVGTTLTFDGFLVLYREGQDDPENQEESRLLPDLAVNTQLYLTSSEPDSQAIEIEKHFTQPPPRYSEASLIKTLEELGIGRPSTYNAILHTLRDRAYVQLEKRRFIPEERGHLVTAFLTHFFGRYVEPAFTADLENKLDNISDGRIAWQDVLRDFWAPFDIDTSQVLELPAPQILEVLDEALSPYFFPDLNEDARCCPDCQSQENKGQLGLKLGKYGAFLGCSNYPECRYTRPIKRGDNNDSEEDYPDQAKLTSESHLIGVDPKTGFPISLRRGPYGLYIQLGDSHAGIKPKRASLPRGMNIDDLNLEVALGLLSLPREVGLDPETGKTILAGLGRYGPYVKLGTVYARLESNDDLLTIGLNRAIHLLAEKTRKAGGHKIGDHPEDGGTITLHKGRYGPYIRYGQTVISLPKGNNEQDISLDVALQLIREKKSLKKDSPVKKKASSNSQKTAKKTKTDKKKKDSKKKTSS